MKTASLSNENFEDLETSLGESPTFVVSFKRTKLNGKHIKWIIALMKPIYFTVRKDMKSLRNQYFVFSNRPQNLILAKFLYFFPFAKFNSCKMKKFAYFLFAKSQKLILVKIITRENLFL